jgi:ribosomal protein S18 acetylase RimI-like enzyme
MHFKVVEENLRAAMRCYSRVCDRGDAHDYPGVTVSYCGLSAAVFNSALLNTPVGEGEFLKSIAMASVHFRQRSVGWTLWLCEDLLSDYSLRKRVSGLARDNGLDPIANPPGMYAERLEPPRQELPVLAYRKVLDAPTRLDFAHLSSVIFSLPYQTSKQVYGSESLWSGPMSGWVGYLNGQAVTLACVVIAAGAAGVYSVGTLPAFQRRGFAEAIMRHALAESRAEAGSEITVLQSTPQGIRLYTRMGYRPVTRFGVYMYDNWRRN